MTNLNSPPDVRAKLVETVQTPLGFFSLVVLVVEVILGISANLSSGKDRTYLIFGMLGLIFLLVLIVTVMALFRPLSLYGKTTQLNVPINTHSKFEEATSKVQVIKNPKVLLARGISYEHLDEDFIHTEKIIRQAFPKAQVAVHQLTPNEFRRLLTKDKFDIVQITVDIRTYRDSGDVRVYFGHGEDFMPGDGFVELLEVSETKLIIIASCNSVPLAAKLATRVNMIASSDWLALDAFSYWQQVFYQLLAQEVPLSRAYSVATSTVRLPMAMMMKQDAVFVAKNSKVPAT
jgi:hypothetical protein